MARPKVKESEARSFKLRADLCKKLDAYSEHTHIPKTVIVELALGEYLQRMTAAEKFQTLVCPISDDTTKSDI